jgi:nucleoside-diphosphate-sugar epimerase
MLGTRVLVTGAAGFVGAVLCRRLLAKGFGVHALLRDPRRSWRIADVLPDIHVHEVDIRDEERLSRTVRAIRPEIVYHLATYGAYPHQTDADATIQTDIVGTWNLLKAMLTVDYRVFVNTGSSSEYGFKQYAMRETDLLEPNSYYSAAKCAQSLLCQHVARTEKRPVTTFRLFSAYGPYEEPTRLVPTLIRRCLAGQPLDLVSPEVARDFVFVEDVVDAYLRIDALAKLSGEIINIGTGVQHTIRDIVETVLRETNATVECRWGSLESRIWDTSIWVADCTKSRRLLDWRPRTPLEDGIRLTVEWARSQGEGDAVPHMQH